MSIKPIAVQRHGQERHALTRVQVERNAALSVANATYTEVPFDTEVFDVGGMWAPGSPTQVVLPFSGRLYLINGFVQFAAGATGRRWAEIAIGGLGRASLRTAATDAGAMLTVDLPWRTTAANEIVTFAVEHSQGVALDVLVARLTVFDLGT